MTETRLKEPESNRMGMSHAMVTLTTMTAERKQHAWELETMRQMYEASMKRAEDVTKRAEDLAKENELLKRELERKEVEETLRRKKEKKMEEQEMGNPDTSLVGDAKPMDTAKWEPEIEVRPLVKQGEVRRSQIPLIVTVALLGPL